VAIKGGSIIHVGNGDTLIDRVQTGGPGQVNIPTEKIYELGNYKSVATVRDTPDLTFSLESYDVSTEIEALLSGMAQGRTTADASIDAASPTLTSASGNFTAADVGKTVIVRGAGADGADLTTTITAVTNQTTVTLADNATTAVADGIFRLIGEVGGYDLAKAKPVDFASQFKAGQDAADPFKVVASVALPFLYVEQMSYRFGLRDNATQSASLRGDTIFYNPGATFVEEVAGSGAAGQTIVTEHPAFQVAAGDQRRVLAVTAGKNRLNFGADYAETYGAVANGAAVTTVTLEDAVPADETVRIMYSSPDRVEYTQTAHPSATVKPAAVKGKDIEVYVGGYDPDDVLGSQVNKMTSVQAVNVDWRVTIDKDEEFGNYYAVGLDFDVPQVNGSVDIKPRDPAEFNALVRQVSGVTDPNKVVGTSTSVPLPLDVVVKNPETGQTLKRLHVPDARFTPPGYSGRVQQKTTITMNYESDEGTLIVFDR
jgi:hypothetical protein